MKKEMKIYEPPLIKAQSIQLEQGIAAGSAAIGNPNPGLDEWGDGESATQNGDF